MYFFLLSDVGERECENRVGEGRRLAVRRVKSVARSPQCPGDLAPTIFRRSRSACGPGARVSSEMAQDTRRETRVEKSTVSNALPSHRVQLGEWPLQQVANAHHRPAKKCIAKRGKTQGRCLRTLILARTASRSLASFSAFACVWRCASRADILGESFSLSIMVLPLLDASAASPSWSIMVGCDAFAVCYFPTF